jgi:photosystem II stability/assembly factor-like uncharacterized protein
MSELLAATQDGVYVIQKGKAKPEEGPAGVHFLARAANAAFAVTDGGAIWRRDAGGWRLVNDRAMEDDVWSFAADPRLPGRLYLGVSPALVYRSDDEGETWTACESLKRMPGYESWTFPPPPHIPHVRSIAVDPAVPGGVYIGVEEGGVYRSRDGGETWEGLNEGLYWDVHTVVPQESGADLYATTGAGFHFSADSGAHWQHVPLPHRYTVPLLATRSKDLLTVAASGPPPTWTNGVNGAIYKSSDGGRSWRRLQQGLPPQLDRMAGALIEDDEGRVCTAFGDRIMISEDSGESWQALAEDVPQVRSLVAA